MINSEPRGFVHPGSCCTGFSKKSCIFFFRYRIKSLIDSNLFCVDSHGPNGIPAEFPIIFLDAIILLIVFLADLG
jgi:hypothetical protein